MKQSSALLVWVSLATSQKETRHGDVQQGYDDRVEIVGDAGIRKVSIARVRPMSEEMGNRYYSSTPLR